MTSEESESSKKSLLNSVEWKVKDISSVTQVIGGGTPSTKNSKYWGGDIPWITPKDLSGYSYRYITHGERNITEAGLKNSSAKLIPKNSILLTTRAPIGYLAIAKIDVTTNQGIHSLVPNDDVSPLFLYYLLKNNIEYLKSNANGSTFGELSQSSLKQLHFAFPELDEQIKNAKILSDLDSKIELNKQMNKTLESIAQAIFKSWFMDFDPVRAKMVGESPESICKRLKLTPEILDMFPDRLVDSELGKIPEGWGVKPLGDLIELAYGKPLKAENRIHGSVPVYGSNGLIDWNDKKLIKGPGIIVGRKGNPGTVTWVQSDFYPIDTTFYVVPKSRIGLHFLYYALMHHNLPLLGTDSAVPGLNRNLVYISKQLVPHNNLCTVFENLTEKLLLSSYNLNKQSMVITEIRDTLLPKLISGKIRVPVGDANE